MTGTGKRRLAALAAATALAASLGAGVAGAQGQPPEWRGEFEGVCVKTDLALSLSSEELADLVARCDKLAGRIAAEGEIVRRVYLKRLQACRALFAYVLETRGVAQPGAGAPATPLPEVPNPPTVPQEGKPGP